jgi:diguanylate cyclase (GGDEF)-like protein
MNPIDVLVVDDDEASRRAVLAAVTSLGYQCRAAVDGLAALEDYEREPTPIVLTDWVMPRLDGLQLCQALKQRPVAPYVIVMTGLEQKTRLLEAIRGGADEFLHKPIDLDELEVRLVAAARLVRAQRELADLNRRLNREHEDDVRVARTDPLTSIGNRRRLEEDLSRALGDAERYGRRYSAAICDVDHFKEYNDQNGHLAGDVALQKIAAVLQSAIRTSDSVYRYGGDEFFVLLPEQTEAEGALAMGRICSLVEALSIPISSGGTGGVLTLSAGVAELGNEGRDAWVARADAALYQAKAEGRNRTRTEPGTRHATAPVKSTAPGAPVRSG